MTLDIVKLVESVSGRPTTCMTCRWIMKRPDDEHAGWDKVMSDPKRWQHSAIHRAIRQVDPAGPGQNSIAHHRNEGHRK